MDAQTRKAHAFKALHEGDGVFVIPNPWDAGSAKMLASLGYQALATTSAGCAFSMARADGAGNPGFEGDALLGQGDLDLLGVGRERVLEDLDGGVGHGGVSLC